jgi:hypothetical protein
MLCQKRLRLSRKVDECDALPLGLSSGLVSAACRQGLTLVYFSPQHNPFYSVSRCVQFVTSCDKSTLTNQH